MGENPYFLVNEKPVERSELDNYNAEDIGLLVSYFDKQAVKLYGQKAKDGVVMVYTKDFATQKYEALFSSHSESYSQMIVETPRENIQYIVNGQSFTKNSNARMALLTEDRLKSLEVVDQQELIKKYNVTDKTVGVIIKAKFPKLMSSGKSSNP